MAKKMRTIMNPLDRSTRNDLNYNFGAIDDNFDSMNVEFHDELKGLDAKLDEMMDGRLIDELYDAAKDARDEASEAKAKGNYANDRGKYADGRGKYAQTQGDYAKEQGDFAKEKGEETANLTAKIKEENADLQNIKNEAIDATQKTKVAMQKTNEATNKANAATDKTNESATNADNQAKYAKEQGDYAKLEADKAKDLTDRMKHIGTWSDSVSYKKDNEVEYNGSTYRAKKDNKGVVPTEESTWQLIALRGVDGKGAVGSVNGKKPTADGNVDLGELVHSVAGIAPDLAGDVPLTIGDLTTDRYLPPNALPHHYLLGVTMFKTNNSNESDEWKELIPNSAPGSRFLIVTYKADERWQARQVIMEVLGYNTGITSRFGSVYVRGAMGNWENKSNGWSDLVKLLDNMDLSDSTTSDSSDKVATSKAVKYLNDALIGTDDDLRDHKLTKGAWKKAGHVELSNLTSSTSSDADGVAATPYAVKQAMDRANEAFQLGDSAKKEVVSAIKVANFDSEITNESEWSAIANEIKTYNKVFDISLYIRENQKIDIPFLPKLIVPETDSDRRVLVSKVSDAQWKVHEEDGNDLATILLVPKALQVLYYKGKEFNIRVVGVAGLL